MRAGDILPDKYDIAVKDLFGDMDSRRDMVRFFTRSNFQLTGDLSIEFTRVEKRLADFLLLAEDEAGPLAVHAEFQSRNDPRIGPRMLRYAAEILKKYRLRVHQTVIYFGNAELSMVSGLSYHFDENTRLDFSYRLVDLGQFTRAEINSHPNHHLRAFLPVVERIRRKAEGARFLETCVDDIMVADLPLEEKSLVILHAELLAGLAFTGEIIKKAFERVEVMLNLRESAGYRRLFREAEEMGEKRGEKRGETKGKMQAAKDFLARRFGEESIRLQAKVTKLTDLDVLSGVLAELFSANTIEEARVIIEEGLKQSSPKKNSSRS